MDYDTLTQVLSDLGQERGEWAGIPVPLPELKLSIEPNYPYQYPDEMNGQDRDANHCWPEFQPPDDPDRKSNWTLINQWHNRAKKRMVYVCRTDDGRSKVVSVPRSHTSITLTAMLDTLGACCVWPLEAELKAQESLYELIGAHRLRMYVTTGTFLETSKRSGIIYLFRRCRSTIAIRGSEKYGIKGICALCLHPIAYYQDSFAGTMVPTDDVIAHLMLMRGDEHMFWRRSNQHSLESPLVGL